MRFTHDTGAACTAFPADFPGVKTPPEANASYRTASGELLADSGGLTLTGVTEYGERVRLAGRCTEVHKPLVSAARVHQKGRCSWIEAGGGYIIPSDGRLAKDIKKLIERRVGAEKGVIPLWEEYGTYVGYVKMGVPRATPSKPLCPVGADEVFRGQAARP